MPTSTVGDVIIPNVRAKTRGLFADGDIVAAAKAALASLRERSGSEPGALSVSNVGGALSAADGEGSLSDPDR